MYLHFALPCITHWLLTQSSPGVFLGRDLPVSGSINFTSKFGRMKPTEFLCVLPNPFCANVSVMQLCSVSPYACKRINLHLRNTYYNYLGRGFGLRAVSNLTHLYGLTY
jgi:hypothetical protein